MTSSESTSLRFYRTFARFASSTVVLLGSLALVGWAFHVEALKRIIPRSDPVKPNMATAILLCGAALLLLSRKRLTMPIRICAAAIATTVIILSALTIGEYLLNWDFGIEQWLIGDVRADLENPHPGRMAPITVACFLLVGVALFAASRQMQKRSRLRLVGGLGGTLTAAGAVPLIGFLLEMLFGPNWNYMGVTPTGIVGAIAFLLLGIGLLALLRSNAHLTWSLDGLTTAGFASGFTLMILAAGLTYNFTVKMHQAAMQVGHAQEIRRVLNETEAGLLELEHEQRSYIITANEYLLDQWNAKESEIRDHFRKLQRLEINNSSQQPVLRQLGALVSKRLNWAKQTTEIRRKRGLPAAQEMIATGTGVALLEQSRGLIQGIETDEDARLRESQTQSGLASQSVFLMLPRGGFGCFAIISLGVFFLNSGMGERKTAERELRESEERYRSLFESNPNPMWIYDLETLSFLAVNSTAVGHYGYSQDEFLGMTLKDIRPPEDIPALMDDLSEKTDDVNDSIQWRHRKKDGTLIDVEITSHELTWLRHRAKLVLINDITERKRAEKHLAQMEGRYRGLLEAAPDAMVVVNQGGQIVLLNLQAEKQFGYRRDELVGQKVKNIIPEGFAERLVADDLRSAEDALAQQIGTGIELSALRKDGSEFPIEIMLSPLESTEGILVTAAIRDISARKAAEQHLAQMEGRYRGLLEAAPDAMVVVNQVGEIVLLNVQAEKQFGYRRDELVGQKVKNIIPEGFAERLIADALRSAEDELAQQIGTGIELSGRRKDGSEFPIEIMLSPLESAEGVLVTAAIRNITVRKLAESQLLQAQKLESIGRLAGGIAHDFNNMLFAIHGYAELLSQDLAPMNRARFDPESALLSVKAISDASERAAALTAQLLAFSRQQV